MLLAAIPLVVADLTALPAGDLLWNADVRADAAVLEEFIASRQGASEWHLKGRDYTDIALARMRLARDAPARGTDHLALAERSLRTGLSLSPASRLGWLRLAQLRLSAYAEGPASVQGAARVARPLSISLRYGAAPEPRTLALIAQAGMVAWHHLDEPRQRQVAEVVRQAWRADPLATAFAAKRLHRSDVLATLLSRRT